MPAQRYERVWMPQPRKDTARIAGPGAPELHRRLELTMRYTQIAEHDEDETSPSNLEAPYPIPASPPPSFHSRASSPTGGASQRLLSDDPLDNDADRTLADTFDNDSDDEEEGDGRDDRQRLMRGIPEEHRDSSDDEHIRPGAIQRRVTQLPVFNTQAPTAGRIYGGGNNDGVFANLSAKPTRGEEVEEKPPVRIFAHSTHA